MKLSQQMWMSLGIISIFLVALVVVQAADKDEKNQAEKTQVLKVQFNTKAAGGKYAPKNVGAVWLSDSNGNYKDTLYIWGKKQKKQLKDWITARKDQKTDAVTGATRKNHNGPVEFTYTLPSNMDTFDKLTLQLMVTDSNKASKKHMTDVALTSLTQSTSFAIESQDGFKNIMVELVKPEKE